MQIAFASNRPDGTGDDFDLYIYERGTDRVFALPGANTEADETHPRESHDGRWILYEHRPRGGDTDLWLYDLGAQAVDTLAPLNTEADELDGAIDKSGERIAFIRRANERAEARFFHLPTRTELIPAPIKAFDGNVRNVSLSGDGKRLALSIANEAGKGDLYFYDIERGVFLTLPFVNSPADEVSVALSADGRLVIFSSDRRGSLDAYIADLETGMIDDLPLANSPFTEITARFFGGPDAILFNSNRTGLFHMYIYDRKTHMLDTLPVVLEPGFADRR